MLKMKINLIIVVLVFSLASCSVIIPEELPSLLSVAYSNIPPIKKGTDSRIGFGFAFGNHADFQVMLELGPQTNTMNLSEFVSLLNIVNDPTYNMKSGQPFPKSSNSNKRQAPPHTIKNTHEHITDPSNYLRNWAQKMKTPQKIKKPTQKPGEVTNLEDSVVELIKNSNGHYEIHQPKPGNMPRHVLENLKKLYGEKREEAMKLTERKRSNEQVKKITEDLSNVDLD